MTIFLNLILLLAMSDLMAVSSSLSKLLGTVAVLPWRMVRHNPQIGFAALAKKCYICNLNVTLLQFLKYAIRTRT